MIDFKLTDDNIANRHVALYAEEGACKRCRRLETMHHRVETLSPSYPTGGKSARHPDLWVMDVNYNDMHRYPI